MSSDTKAQGKTSWLGSRIARRWFLARLGAGAGLVGAAAVGGSAAMAETPADASARAAWKPTLHSQDDWLEKIPGQHRFVFDTVSPAGLDLAFTFGGNYFTASHAAYGLEDHDMAVVMIVRHKSTSFGYNDAMWAKYGKQFSEQSGYTDPKTTAAPTANLYAERMDGLVKKGVQFAVCQMSSRRIAGMIAQATGRDAAEILKEMAANLRPNARIVPAGIVAVNHTQERGYSLVYAG
jgi:intracellular sulfur oxidation DsrE/DsrF family protein